MLENSISIFNNL